MSVIWIPNPTEAWVPATVVSTTATNITVRQKYTNVETVIPGPLSKYDIVADGSLEQSCENLVDLESYSEGIILHHVRTRFGSGSIYTFVGDILVAVNPYVSLDIYGLKVMEDVFISVRRIDSKPIPHVFSIAAMSLNRMKEEQKSQCVLISGESGAGKTETTKKILQFISTMSKTSSSRGSISVENQIIDSNPILESFGNAKTIRNNNSSRFGKYMEINFDRRNCIKGCNVTSYLLEKTRVVRVAQLERNYHIFYMLVAGATIEQRKEFYLKNIEQFDYLTQGECVTIEKRNDALEYQQLIEAMNHLGFDDMFKHDIFQAISGILHLGNLEFNSKGDEGATISSANDCKNIAKFLGFSDPDLLETTLCYRENIVNKETFMIPLNPLKAKDQRDALAKYVYGRIFDVIVSFINGSLFRGKDGNNIGILDIFGFEVFVDNSFEQLCINYCNERLQTFFNEIIFEGEMKMYLADGVNCDDISFQDNIDCVKLIDLKGAGIFSILDEQVILPGGTDDKFIQKLNQVFDDNPATKSVCYIRNRRKPKDFGIKHFAGDVHYNVENFLEKNKDSIATSLVKLINQSKIGFIHTPDAEIERSSVQSSNQPPLSPSGKQSTKLTLSAKFKLDLDNLIIALRSTTPYFIRCIKPNDFQQAQVFHSPLVLGQLKYSGLFEAVSIRKAGYAVRMLHKVFIDRYKHCVEPRLSNDLMKSDPKQYCQLLFEQIFPKLSNSSSPPPPPPPSGMIKGAPPPPPPPPPKGRNSIQGRILQAWCVGHTRVYIRTQEIKIQLDRYRYLKGASLVYRIQSLIRGFIIRTRTNRMLGISREQKLKEKKRMELERIEMEKEDKKSLENEILFRNDLELQKRIIEAKKARMRAENERKMKIAITASIMIQKYLRGYFGRKRGRRFIVEKCFERGIESQNQEEILHAIQLQRKYNVTSKLIKTYQYHSRALLLNMFNESHVINQLEEAIASGTMELLINAIELADKNNMMYLPVYQIAQDTIKSLNQKRQVIKILEEEMIFNTTSIPKLINRVDNIRKLIHDAIQLGLASTEPIVYEAALRLSKIDSLIKLRDEMRSSVELCAINHMKSLLIKREELIQIYGNELYQMEYEAITGMLRMLQYDQQINEYYRIDTVLQKKSMSINIPGTIKSQFLSSLDHSDDEDSDDEQQSKSDHDDDIKLPKFIKDILDRIHFAQTIDDINEAENEFQLVVPIPAKQRIYRRLFKWVVSQARWKYIKPTDELTEKDLLKIESQIKPASMNEITNDLHPLANKVHIPRMSSILNKSLSLSPTKTTMKESFNQSPLNQANIGKGWSFGSPSLKSTFPMKSNTKLNTNKDIQTMKGSKSLIKNQTTNVKHKVKDVFASIDEILAERGLGLPMDIDTMTHSSNKSSSKHRSMGKHGEDRSMMSMDVGNMPYAMRQSKSQVAAFEALKKGKKVTVSKAVHNADRLIDEAIHEYEQFYGKHRIDPGIWK